jgi:uncharacterized RDD family membrane protein YckC
LQLWQRSDIKQAAAWALALPFVAAGFLLALGFGIPLVVGYEPGEISWDGSFPFFIFALLLAAFGVYLQIKVRRARPVGSGYTRTG